MPGRFELKPTLAKVWHAPDHFRILDPLPSPHRKGLIFAFAMVIVGFLLPVEDDTTSPPQQQRDAQLDIQPHSQSPAPSVAASQPAPVVTTSPQSAPLEPEPVQEQEQAQAQPEPPHSAPAHAASGIEQQWRTYRVEQGKTMAQLFRDHNLPPTDVYAMAQVEGNGKPLSNLQSGQMVKIRQNASGVVTGLTIEGGDGQPVLFTRQTNGSFIRAQ